VVVTTLIDFGLGHGNALAVFPLLVVNLAEVYRFVGFDDLELGAPEQPFYVEGLTDGLVSFQVRLVL
jgi:hypothetical protein